MIRQTLPRRMQPKLVSMLPKRLDEAALPTPFVDELLALTTNHTTGSLASGDCTVVRSPFVEDALGAVGNGCLLYTSPSPRDRG